MPIHRHKRAGALSAILALLTAGATLVPGAAWADPAQQRLDKLFAQMQVARTEVEAGAIQTEIQAIWRVSGSDTADLLMVRVDVLRGEGDLASASIVADAVVDLYPEFAEGWFRRAQLRIARDEGPEANRDLLRALQIEPRHFAALEILGGLYEAQQDPDKALETYRQFLALNPLSDSIRQKVAVLERRAEGQTAQPPPPVVQAPVEPGPESRTAPAIPLKPPPAPAAPETTPATPPI